MNPFHPWRVLAPLVLIAAPAAEAAVCRVAPDGNGNGTSWSSPMALHAALASDGCGEIWVRKGLYKPVVPAGSRPTEEERLVSFAVLPGTRVYGGFAGSESVRDQRDPAANRSVLSGDIDGDDTTDADGIVTTIGGARNGNSFHVVAMDGGTARGPVTRATTLDGLIVTAGRAGGSQADLHDHGGGLFCIATNSGQECSPTLRNVVFSGNWARQGGAMALIGVSGGISRPWMRYVRFAANEAIYGGALYNRASPAGHASPELVDVDFAGNKASNDGGAIFNNGKQGTSSPSLNRIGFSGNSASRGGALYNDATSGGTARAYVTNATFSGNNASVYGGAIYNQVGDGDGRMTLIHATFSGNGAPRGGAIANQGLSNNADKSGQTLLGSILWGDTASQSGPEIHNSNAKPVIRGSIVAGGCPEGSDCSGLVSGNPALGALADNGGFSRTLLPNAGSAAIDAADSATCPGTDQRQVPRAQGTRCDIGAVEVEAPACHVKHDATGSNDGTNWANAYTRLQDALANASCGEIRVAKGVYTPTDGSDTSASFAIRPGQRVYGGFTGNELRLDQRDPATNRTVLSGDIDRNDVTDADGVVVERQGSNSKRVVLMDGTTTLGPITATTVLEGFAITGASGFEVQGGGLYCKGGGSGKECSPTLRNLRFSANFADEGGAIYNDGMANGRASPTLVNVTFQDNSASYGGSAMYNAGRGGDSSPRLVNVTFAGNATTTAMVNDGSNGGSSSPVLNHVTFHGNRDRFTAASMRNLGGFGGASEPVLTNVIVWGGAFTLPEEAGECGGHVEICNQSATPTIRAGLIAGGCPAGAICGPDVRDLDPKLGPLADNGGVGPTLMPGLDSPAIDAAADDVCVETDQRGVSRPQGARCDIGALEAIDDRIFASGFETL